VNRTASDLSIGQRQMAEIARAFAEVEAPVRLVILDEPTSSLDAAAAERLLGFLRRASERGIAALFISHRLKEVVSVADRVVVMRDGAVVGDEPAARVSDHRLVELMSGGVHRQEAQRSARSPDSGAKRVIVERAGVPVLGVGEGEVVGLAGLDGHGQRDLLHRIFLNRPRSAERIVTNGQLAYVSGDRQREGVFPLWSIGRNITIGLLRILSAWGLLRPSAELRIGNEWREQIGIRTPDIQLPILSLSGGNQQKVLIARALASGAALILLDDPTRGIDVTTKWDLYRRVREEATGGRSFLWYTTEYDELEVCDRVYVFYEGRITDDIGHAELSEDRVLKASFARIQADAA
jgi:ribose transport system ATP-binding protein